MLYTRTGDDGTSGLFGTSKRFSKDSSVYDALGTVDELNSLLGLCRAHPHRLNPDIGISHEIKKVQERLFIIQAELAGAKKSITKLQVEELEGTIDYIERLLRNPHAFVIPGSTELSALFDYARAVARRAERAILKAYATQDISPATRAYLNRLSSLLYTLARYAAGREGVRESSPSYA